MPRERLLVEIYHKPVKRSLGNLGKDVTYAVMEVVEVVVVSVVMVVVMVVVVGDEGSYTGNVREGG